MSKAVSPSISPALTDDNERLSSISAADTGSSFIAITARAASDISLKYTMALASNGANGKVLIVT